MDSRAAWLGTGYDAFFRGPFDQALEELAAAEVMEEPAVVLAVVVAAEVGAALVVALVEAVVEAVEAVAETDASLALSAEEREA